MDALSVDSTLMGLALYASRQKKRRNSFPQEVADLTDIGLQTVYEPSSGGTIPVDIIFVHGLQGDPRTTWTGLKGFWPQTLFPKDVESARILTFGYLDLLGEGMTTTLRSLGELMLGAIVRDRLEGNHSRPIIFVAHSLGGLVVKSALVHANLAGKLDPNAADIINATKGICFLGTPHTGSSRAGWDNTISLIWNALSSVSEQESGEMKRSFSIVKFEIAIRINSLFAEIAGHYQIPILSFYEKIATFITTGRVIIVDEQSAKIGVESEVLVPISAKHSDLGKFGSQKASEYQAFLAFIRGIIRISHSRIDLGFPEDTKFEIESSCADVSPSDHTSLSSERHLDIPEKERRFLKRLRFRNWVDGSTIPENEGGTHDWLEESSQWKQWIEGDETLWITGAQGLGKTHLAKFIINLLRRDTGQSAESAVEGKYFGYDNPTSDTTQLVLSYFCDARRPSTLEGIEVLKSFLHQILTQDAGLFKYLYGTLIFPKALGSFEHFRQAFEMVLRNREGGIVNIIIDAIDECDKKSRDELCGFLTSFESTRSVRVRVILTSRPSADHHPPLVINLNDNYEYHQQDLRLAVQDAINEQALRRRFTVEFSKEIFDTILKKTKGMLATQICLDLLENMPTVLATREILRRLPENVQLSHLFLELLNLRTDSNRSTLILAYYFTCCSRRTFTLDELLALLAATTAAGVGKSWPQINEIHESVNLNVEQILKTSRREFLVVQDGTVALIHGALTEFLLSPDPLRYFLEAIKEYDRCSRFQLTSPSEGLVQCLMAEACLKYMNAAVRSDPLHASEYCFEFWSVHAREAQLHMSEELVALVSDFLDPRSRESQQVCSSMLTYLRELDGSRLLPPPDEPTSILAALDLCHIFAGPLGVTVSSFRDPDSSGHLPLHYAASNSAVDSAEWILKESKRLGLDIESIVNAPSGDDRMTALQIATKQGKLSMVKLLLDAVGKDLALVLSLMPLAADNSQRAVFATLWARCSDSWTMLSPAQKESILGWAVSMDNKEAALELLTNQTTAGLSVESSVLHQAVETQSPEIVLMLVQRNADINARNSEGSSPLHIAARLGNDPILDILLNRPGIKVNQVDKQGRTPLHLASQHGFLRSCTHLLARGSSVNLIDATGRLPAHYACDIGHDKLLKLLLDRGSDTLIADNKNKTMLMLASRKGHDPVVRMLLDDPEVDVDVNAADLEGSTALHHGVYSGNVSIVSRLLIAGAVIDVKDNNGFTPLHIAASQSADIIVNELLQNGADRNALDHDGRMPLHLALRRQRHPSETVVNALLNRRAEVDLQDKDGCTALHYACQICHLPSIILLWQYRAKSLKNNDGKKPIQLLRENDEQLAMEIKEQLSASPTLEIGGEEI